MCPFCQNTQSIKKRGFYYKRSTRSVKIQRYQCHNCQKSFSDQTGKLSYRDKKPHLNQAIYRIICSGVSQTRSAVILNTTRVTVASKICKLARFARRDHRRWQIQQTTAKEIQFDEMETFEHSKCKPISIALAVNKKDRAIIAAIPATMPAKGRLAKISRKKYGHRPDKRKFALRKLMEEIRLTYPHIETCIRTDNKSAYKTYTKIFFPSVPHLPTKGKRGCVVGQGELKATSYDPIFNLNHNCAMFRDNLKTLTRKTWCTVKKTCRFFDLLDLYIHFHNQFIVAKNKKPFINSEPIM